MQHVVNLFNLFVFLFLIPTTLFLTPGTSGMLSSTDRDLGLTPKIQTFNMEPFVFNVIMSGWRINFYVNLPVLSEKHVMRSHNWITSFSDD